jgi:hypothetical protein
MSRIKATIFPSSLFLLIVLLTPIPSFAVTVLGYAQIVDLQWNSGTSKWLITWIAGANEANQGPHTHNRIGAMGHLLSKTAGCGSGGRTWSIVQSFASTEWSEGVAVSKDGIY